MVHKLYSKMVMKSDAEPIDSYSTLPPGSLSEERVSAGNCKVGGWVVRSLGFVSSKMTLANM